MCCLVIIFLYFNSKGCKRLPKKLPLDKSQNAILPNGMVLVRLLMYDSASYKTKTRLGTQDEDKTNGLKKIFTYRKMVNNSRRHNHPPHHKLPKRKQQQKNNAAVPEDHKIYSTFKPVNAEENSGESWFLYRFYKGLRFAKFLMFSKDFLKVLNFLRFLKGFFWSYWIFYNDHNVHKSTLLFKPVNTSKGQLISKDVLMMSSFRQKNKVFRD